MIVKEDSPAVLKCSFGSEDISGQVFDWKRDDGTDVAISKSGTFSIEDQQFIGRVKHFKDQLAFGNASIVIIQSKVTDNGTYTCKFPYHQPVIRSRVELLVGECLCGTWFDNIGRAVLATPPVYSLCANPS